MNPSTILKHFPVRVTAVTDILLHLHDTEIDPDELRWAVKAQQSADPIVQRCTVHFNLRGTDLAPRVGSILLVTISEDDPTTPPDPC